MKQAHAALRTAVAVALLSSLAVPALALTQASLSMTDFSYTLKDLNAADGLAPALNWEAGPYLNASSGDQRQSGWTLSGTDLSSDWQYAGSNEQYSQSASVNVSSPLGQAWGSVSANGGAPGVLSVGTNLSAGFGGFAVVSSSHAFTLSANTQVTLSFDLIGGLAGSGNTSGWTASPYGPSTGEQQSSMDYTANISVGGASTAITGRAGGWWTDVAEPYELIVDGQRLQVTLSNKGTADRDYNLDINLILHGNELAAPVPEPATYALMALGLLAVGCAAKRRRG